MSQAGRGLTLRLGRTTRACECCVSFPKHERFSKMVEVGNCFFSLFSEDVYFDLLTLLEVDIPGLEWIWRIRELESHILLKST